MSASTSLYASRRYEHDGHLVGTSDFDHSNTSSSLRPSFGSHVPAVQTLVPAVAVHNQHPEVGSGNEAELLQQLARKNCGFGQQAESAGVLRRRLVASSSIPPVHYQVREAAAPHHRSLWTLLSARSVCRTAPSAATMLASTSSSHS